MLKSILVGLDGTPGARAGAALAFRWAAAAGATVVGLGVVDEPGICCPQAAPIGGDAVKSARDAAVLARAAREVDRHLADFHDRAAAAGAAARSVRVAGDPHACLAEQAQRADLVVLAREPRFYFATQPESDPVRPLLRDAPRPVVLVPPEPVPGRAVVVAYDGSLQAARALFAFRATGLGAGAPVHLVAVGEAAGPLDRAGEFLAAHGYSPVARPVRATGSVAATLLAAAREVEAGLIVAGAYGRSTVREFFLGSVTRTLLADAPVPLFLFH